MAQNQNNRNRTIDFLVGVLLGTLAGVAIGLLLAPRSGAESRHQISEGLRDMKDKTNRYLDETKCQTEESLHQIKQLVEDKFNQLITHVKV